jgi:hypothetical protein
MARDYAIVLPQFWTGTTGRQLRAAGRDAQLLALYLVTNPHANMIGLYRLALPTLCHEAGFSKEGARKALRSLGEVSFAFYDEDAEEVWVVEMARIQVGLQFGEVLKPGDKRCKGAARELAPFRKSSFYELFVKRYESTFHLDPVVPLDPSGAPTPRATEAPSLPLRSQDQDQDQDHDHDTATRACARPAGGGGPDDLGAFRKKLAGALGLPRIGLGQDRARVLVAFHRWLDLGLEEVLLADCVRLAREKDVTPGHLTWWAGWLDTVPDQELQQLAAAQRPRAAGGA